MKNLSEMVYEASEDQVYAIYLEDGTLYNYYEDEAAAKKEKPCKTRLFFGTSNSGGR